MLTRSLETRCHLAPVLSLSSALFLAHSFLVALPPLCSAGHAPSAGPVYKLFPLLKFSSWRSLQGLLPHILWALPHFLSKAFTDKSIKHFNFLLSMCVYMCKIFKIYLFLFFFFCLSSWLLECKWYKGKNFSYLPPFPSPSFFSVSAMLMLVPHT